MALMTKSAIEAEIPQDGRRICIMRRYDTGRNPALRPVDEHWQELAPSAQLLHESKRGLSWEQYVHRFTAEVLVKHAATVQKLARLACEQDVTILCAERSPEWCHRRLVALACQMYEPELHLHIQ